MAVGDRGWLFLDGLNITIQVATKLTWKSLQGMAISVQIEGNDIAINESGELLLAASLRVFFAWLSIRWVETG
ncbi:MAG: hypothetical protein C0507_05855 [Cyanobacteria bacterium PR.3.49]|nr:hypothetical protein [Cyanobacteria bacterium PR.3.49]